MGQSYNPIDAINRDWTIKIVLVNYDTEIIEEATLLAGLPEWNNKTTYLGDINYKIDYEVSHASTSWANSLRQFMLENSVDGQNIGTSLDEEALEYQKFNPDEPQTIFYPRAGKAIDGFAVEDWLNTNPAVSPPDLGYVLYVFNFAEFDSSDHSTEHWYDYKPVDSDTGETQNWFRLEWDNELNPDVKLQYAGFGGRHNIFVIDPSADQWYLRWARIWWGDPPYDDHPEHCNMDLEDKLDDVDIGTPAGIHQLNVYLNRYLYEPIAYLFVPYRHSPTAYAESGFLKGLVFCMDVNDGVSVDSLTWVTDAARQQYHLEELLPFIPWEVDIEFLDIDDYPAWGSLFWDHSYVDLEGTTIVDGYGMFYDIRDNQRPNYIDTGSDEIQVFGVVFIKQQMEMYADGRTFTGLGGGGQTVIWKTWERYYRPDGITPKDGVSSVQLHETMHAIGLHHTWEYGHYVGDFSYSPMGYFGFHNGTSTFDQNWVQGTYLDQMELELWNEFAQQSDAVGNDELESTYRAQELAFQSFENAEDFYNMMMWQECYDELVKARDFTTNMVYSQYDTTDPTILEWGVDPSPITQDGFMVWFRVTDDFSGVETAGVRLEINDQEYGYYPGSQDGMNWTVIVPPFEILTDSTVAVYALASDWGMNNASMLLFSQEILAVDTTAPPPLEALVIVVAGIGAALLIIGVVVIIYKRRSV